MEGRAPAWYSVLASDVVDHIRRYQGKRHWAEAEHCCWRVGFPRADLRRLQEQRQPHAQGWAAGQTAERFHQHFLTKQVKKCKTSSPCSKTRCCPWRRCCLRVTTRRSSTRSKHGSRRLGVVLPDVLAFDGGRSHWRVDVSPVSLGLSGGSFHWRWHLQTASQGGTFCG